MSTAIGNPSQQDLCAIKDRLAFLEGVSPDSIWTSRINSSALQIKRLRTRAEEAWKMACHHQHNLPELNNLKGPDNLKDLPISHLSSRAVDLDTKSHVLPEGNVLPIRKEPQIEKSFVSTGTQTELEPSQSPEIANLEEQIAQLELRSNAMKTRLDFIQKRSVHDMNVLNLQIQDLHAYSEKISETVRNHGHFYDSRQPRTNPVQRLTPAPTF